jgi:hypothetical protein
MWSMGKSKYVMEGYLVFNTKEVFSIDCTDDFSKFIMPCNYENIENLFYHRMIISSKNKNKWE